jgi:tetratricopeptide (TPR) repeat protein
MNHMLTVTQFLLAQCYFAKRAYEKALEYLRQCLIRNRCLPINARMAMAYCYFNLNKFEMAKVCAERVLQLEPGCADAFLCLAIVYERAEDYTRYF